MSHVCSGFAMHVVRNLDASVLTYAVHELHVYDAFMSGQSFPSAYR